jgi:DNA polymerase-3 subunit gamma/tau
MLAFQPARESAGEQVTASPNRVAQNAPKSPTPKLAAAPSGATAGDEWARIVARLGLQGPVSQLAAHCSLLAKDGARIRLLLDSAGDLFRRPALEEQLAQALTLHFDEAIKLDIEIRPDAQTASIDTPARRQQVQAQDRLQAARASIESDPNIQAMRDIFGATVQPESIKPN